MIGSFKDRTTAALYVEKSPKGFPADVTRRAIAKLRLLDAAINLDDLKTPSGNHLEALKGDRLGQHSIRINNKWRLCFTWADGNAYDAEVTDYH